MAKRDGCVVMDALPASTAEDLWQRLLRQTDIRPKSSPFA
jgi:hypothetical protein